MREIDFYPDQSKNQSPACEQIRRPVDSGINTAESNQNGGTERQKDQAKSKSPLGRRAGEKDAERKVNDGRHHIA